MDICLRGFPDPTFTDDDSLIRISEVIEVDEVSSFRFTDQLTTLIDSVSIESILNVLVDDSFLLLIFSTKLFDDPIGLKKNYSNDGYHAHNEIEDAFDTWSIVVSVVSFIYSWIASASKMSTTDKTRQSIYDLFRASA